LLALVLLMDIAGVDDGGGVKDIIVFVVYDEYWQIKSTEDRNCLPFSVFVCAVCFLLI